MFLLAVTLAHLAFQVVAIHGSFESFLGDGQDGLRREWPFLWFKGKVHNPERKYDKRRTIMEKVIDGPFAA